MATKSRSPHQVRSIALIGQGGSGKTRLGEALLAAARDDDRGSSQHRGPALDRRAEERERERTLSLQSAMLEWRDTRIHLVDAPGSPDFFSDAYPALRAVDCAVFVVDAVEGVGAVHDQLWEACEGLGLPRMVVLNGLDRSEAAFQDHVDALRSRVGKPLAPVQVPQGLGEQFDGIIDLLHQRAVTRNEAGERQVGDVPAEHADMTAANRELLVEAIVETDDELLEAYLEGEEPSPEQLGSDFAAGVARCEFFPLLCTSVDKALGIRMLADFIVDVAPTPAHTAVSVGAVPADEVDALAEAPASAVVVKTVADPYLGRVSEMRVLSGRLTPDTELVLARTGDRVKLAHLQWIDGNEQRPCEEAGPGDLVAVAKVEGLRTNDTLRAPELDLALDPVVPPQGHHRVAVRPTGTGDEDKLSMGLSRLGDEDPGLVVERSDELRQIVLHTQGPGHADVTIARLKERFGVGVEPEPARIPYTETVKGKASATGKLKKQTGGAGQFALVELTVAPLERGEGFAFSNEVVGGAVPKQYIPSVEKGVQEAMEEGVLAGYPVVDVGVTLYDGKHHPVDSSQAAFEVAGSLGFQEAAKAAGLLLLEPIKEVAVTVPDAQVGDVMGDLSSRRGRILGSEPAKYGRTVVRAHVPENELRDIVPQLRALSSGSATLRMTDAGRDVAPDHIAQQVVEEAQKESS